LRFLHRFDIATELFSNAEKDALLDGLAAFLYNTVHNTAISPYVFWDKNSGDAMHVFNKMSCPLQALPLPVRFTIIGAVSCSTASQRA